MRRRGRPVVHWWNVADPAPLWHCRAGGPEQDKPGRETTDPHRVTCRRCLRTRCRPGEGQTCNLFPRQHARRSS